MCLLVADLFTVNLFTIQRLKCSNNNLCYCFRITVAFFSIWFLVHSFLTALFMHPLNLQKSFFVDSFVRLRIQFF